MRQAAFGGKLETNASQFQASDAFYAATIAGAQGLHMEIGRIEPGFSADLLLIDPSCFGQHNYPLIEWVYAGQSADIVGRVANRFPIAGATWLSAPQMRRKPHKKPGMPQKR